MRSSTKFRVDLDGMRTTQHSMKAENIRDEKQKMIRHKLNRSHLREDNNQDLNEEKKFKGALKHFRLQTEVIDQKRSEYQPRIC